MCDSESPWPLIWSGLLLREAYLADGLALDGETVDIIKCMSRNGGH
jgi:hypothetical protein